jgi:hypothetical protein
MLHNTNIIKGDKTTMQNFNTDLIKAEWTEQAVRLAFEEHGMPTQKMDYRIFPYDLTSLMKTGRTMNIEVKALDWNQVGYSDFVFEIYQDDQKSKRPQWYTNIDEIDLICFINMKNYTAHFYHAKTLYKRFNAMEAQGCRMGVAHQNMDNRNDCPGFIYKVPHGDCPAAKDYGFKSQIPLTETLYWTGHIIPSIKNVPQCKRIWSQLNKAHWAELKNNQPNNFEEIHADRKSNVIKIITGSNAA